MTFLYQIIYGFYGVRAFALMLFYIVFSYNVVFLFRVLF
jgi:hypothetical protein